MAHRRRMQLFKTIFIVLLSLTLLANNSYAEETTTPPVPVPEAPSLVYCPVEPLLVPLNKRKSLLSLIKLSPTRVYKVADTKIAQVTQNGLIIPVAKGSTKVLVKVISEEGARSGTVAVTSQQFPSCSISIQIVDAIPYKAKIAPKVEVRKVQVGKKSFSVQSVLLPKGIPVDIGLAKQAVGHVDHLKNIAAQRKADVAINGTFFEAYGGIAEPWGTLIRNGELDHLSAIGTTIGFQLDGTAKMANVRIKIEGGTEDSFNSPHNWYAYFINRTPTEGSNSSILFTPSRGSRIGFAYGTAIIVQDGVVTRIAEDENVLIPRNGFVLVLNGTVKNSLGNRFKVGTRVFYKLKYSDAEGNDIDWDQVITAVGAGPRVLKDGKVFIEAEKEGFKEAKILTGAAARSGIGIKADGSVILVTVSKATIRELGEILRKLGAIQGMNLDGGASSGLFGNKKMLTAPGRQISNSLLFGTGLNFQP